MAAHTTLLKISCRGSNINGEEWTTEVWCQRIDKNKTAHLAMAWEFVIHSFLVNTVYKLNWGTAVYLILKNFPNTLYTLAYVIFYFQMPQKQENTNSSALSFLFVNTVYKLNWGTAVYLILKNFPNTLYTLAYVIFYFQKPPKQENTNLSALSFLFVNTV